MTPHHNPTPPATFSYRIRYKRVSSLSDTRGFAASSNTPQALGVSLLLSPIGQPNNSTLVSVCSPQPHKPFTNLSLNRTGLSDQSRILQDSMFSQPPHDDDDDRVISSLLDDEMTSSRARHTHEVRWTEAMGSDHVFFRNTGESSTLSRFLNLIVALGGVCKQGMLGGCFHPLFPRDYLTLNLNQTKLPSEKVWKFYLGHLTPAQKNDLFRAIRAINNRINPASSSNPSKNELPNDNNFYRYIEQFFKHLKKYGSSQDKLHCLADLDLPLPSIPWTFFPDFNEMMDPKNPGRIIGDNPVSIIRNHFTTCSHSLIRSFLEILLIFDPSGDSTSLSSQPVPTAGLSPSTSGDQSLPGDINTLYDELSDFLTRFENLFHEQNPGTTPYFNISSIFSNIPLSDDGEGSVRRGLTVFIFVLNRFRFLQWAFVNQDFKSLRFLKYELPDDCSAYNQMQLLDNLSAFVYAYKQRLQAPSIPSPDLSVTLSPGGEYDDSKPGQPNRYVNLKITGDQADYAIPIDRPINLNFDREEGDSSGIGKPSLPAGASTACSPRGRDHTDVEVADLDSQSHTHATRPRTDSSRDAVDSQATTNPHPDHPQQTPPEVPSGRTSPDGEPVSDQPTNSPVLPFSSQDAEGSFSDQTDASSDGNGTPPVAVPPLPLALFVHTQTPTPVSGLEDDVDPLSTDLSARVAWNTAVKEQPDTVLAELFGLTPTESVAVSKLLTGLGISIQVCTAVVELGMNPNNVTKQLKELNKFSRSITTSLSNLLTKYGLSVSKIDDGDRYFLHFSETKLKEIVGEILQTSTSKISSLTTKQKTILGDIINPNTPLWNLRFYLRYLKIDGIYQLTLFVSQEPPPSDRGTPDSQSVNSLNVFLDDKKFPAIFSRNSLSTNPDFDLYTLRKVVDGSQPRAAGSSSARSQRSDRPSLPTPRTQTSRSYVPPLSVSIIPGGVAEDHLHQTTPFDERRYNRYATELNGLLAPKLSKSTATSGHVSPRLPNSSGSSINGSGRNSGNPSRAVSPMPDGAGLAPYVVHSPTRPGHKKAVMAPEYNIPQAASTGGYSQPRHLELQRRSQNSHAQRIIDYAIQSGTDIVITPLVAQPDTTPGTYPVLPDRSRLSVSASRQTSRSASRHTSRAPSPHSED